MIVVVGAGPAGMAAAVSAAQCDAEVTMIDDNCEAGGQIWRGRKFEHARIQFRRSTSVVSADHATRKLLVETPTGCAEIAYDQLILATGARELFLPFPGWTLPNVIGAGGLQALAKAGLSVQSKRIVVAGSGPLLLATADYFRKHGARVPLVAEQAPFASLLGFSVHLASEPAKLWQALRLRTSLRRTRYLTDCWVEAAEGTDSVQFVRLRRGTRTWTERCDYLAISYGLTPNTELAQLLGCFRVDEIQRTSLDGVYSAGECTGIGGVDRSLIEGQIAGYAAAGFEDKARRLLRGKQKAARFAESLARAFALRSEVLNLARADTIVCRCEDVTLGQLRGARSWREAKLHHRCGMGPCQGRVCGPIVEALFGWTPVSVRPPIFAARVETLAAGEPR